MRRRIVMAHLLLGIAFLTTSCARLELFRRSDGPVLRPIWPRVGAVAPDIEGEDFAGTRFKLSDYRGKVVVVTFWASWCKYCLERIPHEQSLVNRYQGKPFAFLGVNNDDEQKAALDVIAAHGITWRNWHIGGTKNPVNDRWRIKAWPTTYVIDADGVIRYTQVSGHYLENAIDSLLAEAESKHQR